MSNEKLVKIKAVKQGLMARLLIMRPSQEATHCLHHSSPSWGENLELKALLLFQPSLYRLSKLESHLRSFWPEVS